MGHYRSNLRDIEFNLFEVFGADTRLGTGPFVEMDADTARNVLHELEELATGTLANSFVDGDRHPPVFDPATFSVRMPESFQQSYKIFHDGEWFRLELPTELGGYGATPSLRWACAELVLGANPALFMYSSGPTFGVVVHNNGTEAQQAIARHMINQNWGATMVLTEPDAGSDVGAGRTKARLQADGSWHLDGVKRFITSGDQDMTDNIVHLVLARPEGPGVETRPGTKGLSLFVVPKFLFDWETGELGERNGVYVTGVEHKMGLKVSTTCEVTFGQHDRPAVGWLLGDEHNGIAQMFQIIEYARMMVGTKAIATLSSGYLNALEYAKERVQGADLARSTDKTAPRVTILHHPDVRRLLMQQKAYAEGLRAVYSYTAQWQDRVALTAADQGGDPAAHAVARAVNDLLLPVVKGVGSERAYEQLSRSLQVLGGSGYTQDYPIEQYLRDAKIDTLYEGTTAIQAQDFFFRKIARDRGRALGVVAAEIAEFIGAAFAARPSADRPASDGRGPDSLVPRSTDLSGDLTALRTALEDVQAIVQTLSRYAAEAATDPTSVYRVGEHAVSLLMSVGDLLIGWLLQRQAGVAEQALAGRVSDADRDFYTGKLAVAHWFARNVLPQLSTRRAVIEAADTSLMAVPEAAF
ncbi:acyl-CoA dehydrogenase [Nakamurella leprariae]|uniref:Broad-specificity linear acyl-CoA dehydrogenase FadE5 n=1 Tax=Nakamurella leprariae TaxID=2803911 RepID=A0A938YDQ3_9ACTN|nr:acyl-CoA dehydrogenase [Nakamurella leprariae]MBM9468812.1 acyl-CoA dehydrogenase [Nakamurella leprariae]